MSYEELIALPRWLSWQGHGNQPKPRPLPQICLTKTSHPRSVPYQCLQPPTIGFLQGLSVETTVVLRNRPIRKHKNFKNQPPGPPYFNPQISTLGFLSGAEGATVLFIWVIFGSEVKLCDEGCQGISRTGSMNPGSTQVRGKTQIRVGPNATTLEVDVWQEKSLHPQGELETKRGVCSKFTAGV